MKTTRKVTMPKGVNSKKNSKSNVKILKRFNGQVLVSLEEYKAHRHLFLGTPGNNNLRLEDGREVILVKVIGDKAFPIERVAELLRAFIVFIAGRALLPNDSDAKHHALMDTGRAFRAYCAIMEVLNPDQIKATLYLVRQFDESLYSVLSDGEKLERLVAFSRAECEDPRNFRVKLGNESIDVDYLSCLIEWGYKPLCCKLDDEFDSDEDYFNYSFTIIVGCILVTQLRGMEREEAVEYFLNELGDNSIGNVEFFFNLLTIYKEAA